MNRNTKLERSKELQELLETENQQLQKLNEIVIKSIEEEKLISEKLYEFEDKNPGFDKRLADKIASFGGSWLFILFFLVLMLLWIILNLYMIRKPFDPYPFILLNLALSFQAAYAAPFIMMSQNRQQDVDRTKAAADYQVNIKAELEIELLHEKIDELRTKEVLALTRSVRSLTAALEKEKT